MKWKWRNDRRSERNLCNCVKKPEKNSGLFQASLRNCINCVHFNVHSSSSNNAGLGVILQTWLSPMEGTGLARFCVILLTVIPLKSPHALIALSPAKKHLSPRPSYQTSAPSPFLEYAPRFLLLHFLIVGNAEICKSSMWMISRINNEICVLRF